MLTQLRPLNSTTVTLDNHPNGIGVLLAGSIIGNIECDPVWGLTGTMHATALSLGLVNRDLCFTVAHQVFSTVEQATAQIVADYLASTAVWNDLPDYI